MDVETLKQRFQATYHCVPRGIIRAPGRVNLIGEHTDYNDGPVLPIAGNEIMMMPGLIALSSS